MTDREVPAPDMKARMLRGELYRAVGDEIAADQARAQELLERYNATRHSELELRRQLLEERPGVTIGDDTVVGADAVVTSDLSAGVVAAGVPARPVREIGENDRVDYPRS